jgi:transketolase
VTPPDPERIRTKARFLREETVRLISIAKTGHYASSFSCAEILAVLYGGVLRVRAGEPNWPARDRFLLGKGHAAVALYPLLAELGYIPQTELDGYTRLGSPLGDHPDMRRIPGVDFSSGSLGHALSAGLGMALAAPLVGQTYDVYVLLGDGELHEGQVWEAALAAGHRRVRNLIAIVDRNDFSLDGPVEQVVGLEPLADKWRAFGWQVSEVDGHDVDALLGTFGAIASDEARSRPAVVLARTVKGKGVGFMEREHGWHLGYLDAVDEERVRAELRGTA